MHYPLIPKPAALTPVANGYLMAMRHVKIKFK